MHDDMGQLGTMVAVDETGHHQAGGGMQLAHVLLAGKLGFDCRHSDLLKKLKEKIKTAHAADALENDQVRRR